MYIIRRRWTKELEFAGETLTEMTAKELRDAEAKNDPQVTYKRIDSYRARQLVKDGCHHETGLWVDYDGKMRYAKADPTGNY
jgi:hypothetical protein